MVEIFQGIESSDGFKMKANYSEKLTFEQIKPGPRYATRVSIVDDMLLFEKTLKSRNYPGLQIQRQIIADEDHLSVFPSMISRALVTLLSGYGPYTPG